MANYIKTAIEQEAKRCFDEAKTEMLKRVSEDFDRRKNEVIAAIVLRLEQSTDYQTYTDRLVITVRTPTPNEKR